MSDSSPGGAALAETVMIGVKYIDAILRSQHEIGPCSGNSLLTRRINRRAIVVLERRALMETTDQD